jgi:hypothetical protein
MRLRPFVRNQLRNSNKHKRSAAAVPFLCSACALLFGVSRRKLRNSELKAHCARGGIGERGKGLNYFWLINERRLPRAQWALAGGNFSCLALQTKNNSTCQMTNRSPLYLSAGAGVRRENGCEREKNGHTNIGSAGAAHHLVEMRPRSSAQYSPL